MNQQPRLKRIDGLETIEILVAAAEEELAAVGSVRFNLARVLKKSGISKSSAYHHFGDRDGIIAAVELRHLLGDIRAANSYIRNLIESASDAQSAMSVVAGLIVYSGGVEGMRSRIRRASTIVSAQSSPAMSNVLRDSQRDMAVFLAETFQIAIDRGLISPRVPVDGVAHWFMSLVFGRLLVDITFDDDAQASWTMAVMDSLNSLLRPQFGVAGAPLT